MLFLVGEYYGEKSWGFVGIFDTPHGAVEACGNVQNRFYCPIILNEIAPDKMEFFEDVIYPNA